MSSLSTDYLVGFRVMTTVVLVPEVGREAGSDAHTEHLQPVIPARVRQRSVPVVVHTVASSHLTNKTVKHNITDQFYHQLS